jgi:Spy/CpxP family protein refolding chaperone
MKKVLAAPFFVAVGLALSVVAFAQAPVDRTPSINPQVRRNNRVPLGQRGVNRPIGSPQIGRNRPLGPNQIRKQQLQMRVMQAIGLTPAQRMRMQEIRRSHEDDLAAAGRRLRLSRQALDRAIMSEPYNEAEVRRATEALAAAQADKIRIDASVRSQVRGVLTAEQVQRFNQLQREMRREMKEQQQKEQDKEQEQNRSLVPGSGDEFADIDLLSLLFW